MSFSRSDVSAKKHMARVSDLYGERFRSIKTVLFFIVSVSLLSGEAVPTAALSKVFRKASLSLMKEQFSRLAKSAASNIFWYFVSFRATRVKD